MKETTQTVIKAGKYYTIANANGLVLEGVASAENGAYVLLGRYKKAANQEWAFVRVGEGVYHIQNRGTEKMIDLVSGGSSDGTWLHQWESVGCSSQMWIIEPTNDGRVKIKTQLSMDKCMDIVGMDAHEGAQLQIWQDVNGENQTWNIAPVPVKRTRTVKMATEKADATVKKATPAKKTAAKKVAAKIPTKIAEKATTKEKGAKKTAARKTTVKKTVAPKATTKTTDDTKA